MGIKELLKEHNPITKQRRKLEQRKQELAEAIKLQNVFDNVFARLRGEK